MRTIKKFKVIAPISTYEWSILNGLKEGDILYQSPFCYSDDTPHLGIAGSRYHTTSIHIENNKDLLIPLEGILLSEHPDYEFFKNEAIKGVIENKKEFQENKKAYEEIQERLECNIRQTIESFGLEIEDFEKFKKE